MVKHPLNKLERKRLAEKHEETRKKREAGKVWRKLAEEQLKAKEAENELKSFIKTANHS